MTNNERFDLIQSLGSNGKFFTVTFIKRTTGERRVMNCRLGVTKHLKGGSKPYSDKDHSLVTVYDMKSEGYRSIPLESIMKINDQLV